ncbi:MAG: hypothetical protein V4615_13990 [Bacteroidota bacterium]
MKVHHLPIFAANVSKTYYVNNPPFTTHVFPLGDLENLIKDYHQTHAAFANGGRLQKGDFLIAKGELIAALDIIKEDVNKVAKGNPDVIIDGGFKAVKTFRSKPLMPEAPVIESLERGMSHEILPVCKIVPEAVYYTAILSEGAPLDPRVMVKSNKLIIPKDLTTDIQIDEGKSRKKHFRGLKHLVTYYVYFFVRNSAGISALSEPRSILCVGE